jgi:molybdopterin converting factor subunit 1
LDVEIRVKLFAGLAEMLKQRELILNVQAGTSVLQLREQLMKEYPEAKEELQQALVAVNRTYADGAAQLKEGDEVALIPPVSGGDQLPSCLITADPLDVGKAYAQLESVYHGGTVLFVGSVREWTRGRQTTHLEYDAYQEMALAQMQRIEADVRAAYPGVQTLQWHRVGTLRPADIAVICAAAAPHRGDAFAAARMLIERLKKEVPIWKKEFYADGESTWQANPEASPAADEAASASSGPGVHVTASATPDVKGSSST